MSVVSSELECPATDRRRPAQRLALVVDDESTNRLILRALLREAGLEVVEAADGREAVDRFLERSPDIVFMDVVMPEMDGYEATKQIKAACRDDFVPVIFLTALTDDDAPVRCIDAGGDDFISKPFDTTILRAKILAMERIRELHLRSRSLNSRMRRDEEIAEQVFSGAVIAGNVVLEGLRSVIRPAETFSGDVLLTAHAPSGELHLLFGDFTGHGLAAALGAIPTSEVFRAMTAKGFSVEQIIGGVNNKLFHRLPRGMFMAAQFVRIDRGLEHVEVCNCGMPEMLVISEADGTIKHRVVSRGLPLGIVQDYDVSSAVQRVPIALGDRLLLASDGVTESRGPDGDAFGHERLERAVELPDMPSSLVDAVLAELDAFCDGAVQEDDVSLAEVRCAPAVLSLPTAVARSSAPDSGPWPRLGTDESGWDFSLSLGGEVLKSADPVPLVISQIEELAGRGPERRALFTIVTELFVNALDHGVLGLDSAAKGDAEGFAAYFLERQRRLDAIQEGSVQIGVRGYGCDRGGWLVIRVEDSGPGFDIESVEPREDADAALCVHKRAHNFRTTKTIRPSYLDLSCADTDVVL